MLLINIAFHFSSLQCCCQIHIHRFSVSYCKCIILLCYEVAIVGCCIATFLSYNIITKGTSFSELLKKVTFVMHTYWLVVLGMYFVVRFRGAISTYCTWQCLVLADCQLSRILACRSALCCFCEDHIWCFVSVLCTFQDLETDYGSSSFDLGIEGSASEAEATHFCQYRDCGLGFLHKRSLVRHQRQKHGALFGVARQVAFFCGIDDCKRTFYASSTFVTHQKTVHGIITDELQ